MFEHCLTMLAMQLTVDVKGLKFTCVDMTGIITISPTVGWENWMWQYLKPHKGQVFLDVGSHMGKYTVQVATMIGDGLVVAIEPHPLNFYVLLKNIRRNSLSNVITFNFGAWHEDGKKKLFKGKASSLHSLKSSWEGVQSRQNGIIVEVRRLDNVLKTLGRAVDWIKIDVEGAEMEVLRGLTKTLRDDQPYVIVESKNFEKLKTFMKQFAYTVIPIEEGGNFYCFVDVKEKV